MSTSSTSVATNVADPCPVSGSVETSDKQEKFWDTTMNLVLALLAPKLEYNWEMVADFLPKRFVPEGLTFTPKECKFQFSKILSTVGLGVGKSSPAVEIAPSTLLKFAQIRLITEVYQTLVKGQPIKATEEVEYLYTMKDMDRLENGNEEIGHEELNKIIMESMMTEDEDVEHPDPDIMRMKKLRKKIRLQIEKGLNPGSDDEDETDDGSSDCNSSVNETEETEFDDNVGQHVDHIIEETVVPSDCSIPYFSQSNNERDPSVLEHDYKAKRIKIILHDLMCSLPKGQGSQCEEDAEVIPTTSELESGETSQLVEAAQFAQPKPTPHNVRDTLNVDISLGEDLHILPPVNDIPEVEKMQTNVMKETIPTPNAQLVDTATTPMLMDHDGVPGIRKRKLSAGNTVIKKEELEPQEMNSICEETVKSDLVIHNTPSHSTDKQKDTNVRKSRQLFLLIHERIQAHKYAHKFDLPPANSTAGAAYYSLVKKPKSLKTIKKDITQGLINEFEEYKRDISLMFLNNMIYNSVYNSKLRQYAREMELDTFKILDEYEYTQKLITAKENAEITVDAGDGAQNRSNAKGTS